MRRARAIEFKTYEGANLIVPFAAMVAELEDTPSARLPSQQTRQLLNEIFPDMRRLNVALPGGEITFEILAARLSIFWQELPLTLGFESSVAQLEGRSRIAIGFFDPEIGAKSLRAGIDVANAVFAVAANTEADYAGAGNALRELLQLVHASQFVSVANAYIKAARARGIPERELAPRSKILCYGQGAKSLQMLEAANNRDSHTGYALAKHKAASNAVVRSLGHPGVEHIAVTNIVEARGAALVLGYPLVVKPIDRNGAVGVTADIDTMSELEAAYVYAAERSPTGSVLIERFVAGDDHRLSVFDGKLFRASRLVMPLLVGDGQHSISELIEIDNVRRKEAIAGGAYLYLLSPDGRMIALLRKQGFALEDRPPAGRELRLSTTSNLKTGGAREDVTPLIHPDNIAMAEAVAGSFHLDAVGIDFITPDIGKSWRDVPCAIIEVNANPGTSEGLAVEVTLSRFPNGDDGRILSIMVVESPNLAATIARHLEGGAHASGSPAARIRSWRDRRASGKMKTCLPVSVGSYSIHAVRR